MIKSGYNDRYFLYEASTKCQIVEVNKHSPLTLDKAEACLRDTLTLLYTYDNKQFL